MSFFTAVKVTDGTNNAAVKAASTPAAATDPSLVVAISPNNTVPENVTEWNGTTLSAPPASGVPATGTEVAPVIKNIAHKTTTILSTTPLAGGTNFTSSWFDTNATGDMFASATIYVTGGTNGSLQIQESDDNTNASLTTIVILITYSLAVVNAIQGLIRKRYWRVVASNTGGSLQTTLELTTTSAETGVVSILGQGTANIVSNQIPVSIVSTNQPGDGSAGPLGVWQNNGTVQPLAVSLYQSTGSSSNGVLLRVPNKFLTAAATASGNTAVWTPTSGKKFRLMRYQIELSEDAALASGARITVKFQDATTDFGFQHDLYIPGTGLTATGNAYRSGWIDMGNGYLSAAANNVLNFNIGGGNSLTAGQFRANVCGTEE